LKIPSFLTQIRPKSPHSEIRNLKSEIMKFIQLLSIALLFHCQQATAQHWYLQENQFIYADFWYDKVPSNVTGFHTAIHEIWLPAQSVWRNQLRIDHKYGAGVFPKTKNIATWNVNTGAWVTNSNDTLLYQNGDLQQVITRRPVSGVLQNAWRTNFEYAFPGFVRTRTNQSVANNIWTNDYRDTILFSLNNRPASKIHQLWANPYWADDARDVFQYDANGRLTEYYWQAAINGQFYTGQRDMITYNAAGKRAELRREFVSSGGMSPYDTIFRWKYHYNPAGYLDTLTREQYNRAAYIWQMHTRITFTVNANGIVSQELVQTPSGSSWMNSSRTTYNLTGTPTQDLTEMIDMKVFPNPSEGHFWVNAKFDAPENVRLSVVNASGQVVFEQNYVQVMDLNQNLLLYHLPKGIYWVRLTSSKGQAIRKIANT
jgi:Secretion system C-terminal sorting domain